MTTKFEPTLHFIPGFATAQHPHLWNIRDPLHQPLQPTITRDLERSGRFSTTFKQLASLIRRPFKLVASFPSCRGRALSLGQPKSTNLFKRGRSCILGDGASPFRISPSSPLSTSSSSSTKDHSSQLGISSKIKHSNLRKPTASVDPRLPPPPAANKFGSNIANLRLLRQFSDISSWVAAQLVEDAKCNHSIVQVALIQVMEWKERGRGRKKRPVSTVDGKDKREEQEREKRGG